MIWPNSSIMVYVTLYHGNGCVSQYSTCCTIFFFIWNFHTNHNKKKPASHGTTLPGIIICNFTLLYVCPNHVTLQGGRVHEIMQESSPDLLHTLPRIGLMVETVLPNLSAGHISTVICHTVYTGISPRPIASIVDLY